MFAPCLWRDAAPCPLWASRRSIHQGHWSPEEPARSLPLLLSGAQEVLHDWNELALHRRDDRIRDLRLLPEDLPVLLLSRLYAVELRLPCPAVALRQIRAER